MSDHIEAMADPDTMTDTTEPIPSPCILVCKIEPSTGYCWGCGRTVPEITGWAVYPSEKRLEVMDLLPDRLATMPEREKRVTKRRQLQRQRDRTGSLHDR